LLPLIGLYSVASTGNIYARLYYPVTVAAITVVVGSISLKDTRNALTWKELETASARGVKSDIEGPV
jgi:hypothetical protein